MLFPFLYFGFQALCIYLSSHTYSLALINSFIDYHCLVLPVVSFLFTAEPFIVSAVYFIIESVKSTLREQVLTTVSNLMDASLTLSSSFLRILII